MRIGVGNRKRKIGKREDVHVNNPPFVRVCRLLMDGMYNNNCVCL